VGIVSEGVPQNPLAGTSWQVAAIYDTAVGGVGVVLPDTSLTADFGDGGRMNGSAGCNTYSARYLVEGDQLAITPPTSSSRLCSEPEGIMEQEAAFLSALMAAESYVLADEELQILDAAGNPLLDLLAQP
jgi:heat shock protein HslJ